MTEHDRDRILWAIRVAQAAVEIDGKPNDEASENTVLRSEAEKWRALVARLEAATDEILGPWFPDPGDLDEFCERVNTVGLEEEVKP